MESFLNPPTDSPEEDVFSSETRKKEVVRIILQTLRSFGYDKSAQELEAESGIILEDASVAVFKDNIEQGNWDAVYDTIPSLSMHAKASSKIGFFVKKQKYLELIEKGEYHTALECLRGEVTPLKTDNYEQIHKLAGHLLWTDPQELKEEAQWYGSSPVDRIKLLNKMQDYIPSDVMIRPNRLQHLLNQALSWQVESCKYHRNTGQTSSLLEDHSWSERALEILCHQTLSENTSEVWDVVVNTSGNKIASASAEGKVVIWESGPEGFNKCIEIEEVQEGGIQSLSWSFDDKQILTTGNENTITLLDAVSGQQVLTCAGHQDKAMSTAWLPNHDFCSGGSDKRLIMWGRDGQQRQVWEENVRVRQLNISRDGWVLAVLIASRPEVRCYSTEEQALTCSITAQDKIISMELSQNGTELVTNQSLTRPTISHWVNGVFHKSYTGHKQEKCIINCGFGGRQEEYIVCGSEDGYAYIWNKLHGTILAAIHAHDAICSSVRWSHINPNLFFTCSDDTTVKVWIVQNNEEL